MEQVNRSLFALCAREICRKRPKFRHAVENVENEPKASKANRIDG